MPNHDMKRSLFAIAKAVSHAKGICSVSYEDRYYGCKDDDLVNRILPSVFRAVFCWTNGIWGDLVVAIYISSYASFTATAKTRNQPNIPGISNSPKCKV